MPRNRDTDFQRGRILRMDRRREAARQGASFGIQVAAASAIRGNHRRFLIRQTVQSDARRVGHTFSFMMSWMRRKTYAGIASLVFIEAEMMSVRPG